MPRNNHIIAWIYNIYKAANNRNHLRHLDKQGGLRYRGSVSLLFLWQGKTGMQADFNCDLEIQALSGPIFYILPLVYVSAACLSLSLTLLSCFPALSLLLVLTAVLDLLQVQTPKFPGKGL